MKPVMPLVPASKFRYFAVVPSMALATPSEPGLLADEAMILSLGCTTFLGTETPSSCTSAICMQQVLGPAVLTTVHR